MHVLVQATLAATFRGKTHNKTGVCAADQKVSLRLWLTSHHLRPRIDVQRSNTRCLTPSIAQTSTWYQASQTAGEVNCQLDHAELYLLHLFSGDDES